MYYVAVGIEGKEVVETSNLTLAYEIAKKCKSLGYMARIVKADNKIQLSEEIRHDNIMRGVEE